MPGQAGDKRALAIDWTRIQQSSWREYMQGNGSRMSVVQPVPPKLTVLIVQNLGLVSRPFVESWFQLLELHAGGAGIQTNVSAFASAPTCARHGRSDGGYVCI